MACKPSDAEILAIVDAQTLAEWCGFSTTVPPPTEPPTVPPLVSSLEAFLVGIGLGPQEHYRVVAALATVDFNLYTVDVKFNGARPTLTERGAMLFFHQTARRLCLLEDWPSVALPPVATPSPPTASGSSRLLNLASIQVGKVLDQKIGDEITYVGDDFIQRAYACYMRVMEVMPSPAANVTTEQLTCMDFMLRSARPPYADFSVWGKHGTRSLRRNSFTGVLMQPDGSYKTVELLGPASFEAWAESYEVLCTALIMLDVVRRPRLIAYRVHIQELSELHGPICWPLVYQADVRCRQEWMEGIRLRLLLKHNSALAMGSTTDFRTDKPWDSVWHHAVEDTKFWTREFERPAGKLVNHLAGSRQVIDGDAAVEHHQQAAHNAPRPSPPQQQQQQHQPSPKGQGWKTKNAAGQELCRGFQDGSCLIGKDNGSCGRDSRLRHQCALCLKERHGAMRCNPHHGKGNDSQAKKGKQNHGKKGKKSKKERY